MKKLMLLASVALMLASTSCNGLGGGKTLADCKTADDSLSYYVGIITAQYKNQIAMSPDSANFNADEFIKGYEAVMKVDTGNISYLLGLQSAIQAKFGQKEFAAEGFNLDAATIVKAFTQVVKNDTSAVSPDIAQEQLQAIMIANKMKKNREKSVANVKAGEEFLAKEMAKDKDIKKLESGLAIKVLAPGNGKTFADADVVDIIYTGATINGEEFDSSRGATRKFNIKEPMIAGFVEAVKMMSPGAHYIIYVPSELGYGDQGNARIEPGAMMIFDIETPGKEVQAPDQAPAANAGVVPVR